MEKTQDTVPETQEQTMRENLRVQKTAYIQRELARRREAEDRRMDLLEREQSVIDSLRESIDESLWQTDELRQYNREFQEKVNAQVYEAHGISAEKLKGMRSYRRALYQGVAAVSFLLSVALTIFAGVIHGFSSEICLLMAAYTAAEGALLSQENRPWKPLLWLCRCLYLLTLPVMAVAFVSYELHYPAFNLLSAAIPPVALAALGVLSYFLHDPYGQDRKLLRRASRELRKIERQAKKQVRDAMKAREKEEKAAKKAAAAQPASPAEQPAAVPAAPSETSPPTASAAPAAAETTPPTASAAPAPAEIAPPEEPAAPAPAEIAPPEEPAAPAPAETAPPEEPAAPVPAETAPPEEPAAPAPAKPVVFTVVPESEGKVPETAAAVE